MQESRREFKPKANKKKFFWETLYAFQLKFNASAIIFFIPIF